MPYSPDQNQKIFISKFESMLKTNNVYFFDSTEFEGIIQFYLDNGRQSLAHKAIKLGLDQHPSSVMLRLLGSELLIYEDRLIEADKILSELNAIEPNNEEIYVQKATIFSRKKEHKEAINYLKTALAYADEKADILAMIGVEYLYLDEFENARLNFAKCLEVDFEDYSSLYNVIYCFDMENKHTEAINYLNDFIDKDPYSEVAWHQLGRQYFILEEYEKALRAFDYTVLIDEGFVGAFLEKAKTLEKLSNYSEAIENYLITIELDDPTAFAYYRIGECYHKIGEKDLALKYFKLTVKEDPLFDKAWIALTNNYCDDKRYHKALYYINKAIGIDASNTLFWRVYAEINLKLDFFEEVATAFQKCIELGDDTLDIYIGLSDVLNLIGEFENASKILIKADRLYPNQAEIEYRLACIYFILEEGESGENYLKAALKTDYEYHAVVKEMFPAVFALELVNTLISSHIKSI
ncbi:MAG: tetratricopeptide repeat protein [Flavobacteriaceae bacterium]|nr:tetratricopeptide repeat protein [Flavobacteriaceae bacterium]